MSNGIVTKKCTRCNKEKSVNEFYKFSRSFDGLRSDCKDCTRVRNKSFNRSKDGLVNKMFMHHSQALKTRGIAKDSYTKDDLKNWVFSQDNFELLYDNWVKSGYKRKDCPSIDRLDDYKGYSLGNIQLITWESNHSKFMGDVKSGINNKINKAVVQLSKYGEKLNTFHSIRFASRATGIRDSNIGRVCKGVRRTAGGYCWQYLN